MDAVIMRLIDLPPGINGLTVRDENGDFNIYINARNTRDKQMLTFRHEAAHIEKGHFSEMALAIVLEASLTEDPETVNSPFNGTAPG